MALNTELASRVFFEYAGIKFATNPRDGPTAFDIQFPNGNSIYLADGILQDITGPDKDPDYFARSIDNVTQGAIRFALANNNMTYERLALACTKLHLKDTLGQLDELVLR